MADKADQIGEKQELLEARRRKEGWVSEKRQDYLEWSEYFMAVALLSAQRSKDPSTQVGSCIVRKDKKILGIGYNGMPNGCHDDEMPWAKHHEDELDNKYLYVCHAEMNAIMNKNNNDVSDCTLYTTMFPCNECAKLIIQSGISHVVYLSDKNKNKKAFQASKRLLEMAGVKYSQFSPNKKKILIDFEALESINNNNNNNNDDDDNNN